MAGTGIAAEHDHPGSAGITRRAGSAKSCRGPAVTRPVWKRSPATPVLHSNPIAAAETAAGTTLSYLLNPERAARLIEYNARDAKQPGLMPVIDKLFERTWKSSPLDGYKGELQTLVNNLSLKYLLSLLAAELQSA